MFPLLVTFGCFLVTFDKKNLSTKIFQQTFKFSLPRLQSCSLLLTRYHCWFIKREKPMLTVIINMVVDRSQDHSYDYENRQNDDFVKLKFSDHLLAHRQQNYCFPFRFCYDLCTQIRCAMYDIRVKWRAGKGRCLVASRDINPLELIMFDAAIVTGPQVLS